MQFQHHMWQLFCYIRWFPYFFHTFDSFILTLCSSNIICDNFFLTFGGSLTFFLTFGGYILTLCGSNITLGGSLTFFSHLTVPSSHCAVPTLHVTFFSYIWWFPYFFFFSHLTVTSSHCTVPTSHVTIILSHWMVPLLFFHTWRFHSHIVMFQHHM